ncbi:DUF4190 domain-containing protein [Bacillaceae bacterium IKA-2]|nr:DUF4190 domain-containing protein [Bacillaceae bacterium IKA-2]
MNENNHNYNNNNNVNADENNNIDSGVNGVVTNQNNMNLDNRSLQLANSEKDENPNGTSSADYPNSDYREETTAEFAPERGFVGESQFADDVDEETADGHAAEGRGVGAFAIVLSIISLFFLPVILGAAGIIVGFIARRNNARGLGNSAIGIGAISIILTLFFSPFF